MSEAVVLVHCVYYFVESKNFWLFRAINAPRKPWIDVTVKTADSVRQAERSSGCTDKRSGWVFSGRDIYPAGKGPVWWMYAKNNCLRGIRSTMVCGFCSGGGRHRQKRSYKITLILWPDSNSEIIWNFEVGLERILTSSIDTGLWGLRDSETEWMFATDR